MRPNGAVIYKGPSLIDGKPIVAIAVGLAHASSNAKTGNMLQTYILKSRTDPVTAVRTRADFSICGNCPARGSTDKESAGAPGRTCYVPILQGPLAVYRAYKRGIYPLEQSLAALGERRLVRLGTYGDPAAVPVEVWQSLLKYSDGHTGYTHQWRTATQLQSICMASVDSPIEAAEAQAMGWRTFRVAYPKDKPGIAGIPEHGGSRHLKEAICPASAEAGKKLTCATCLACHGTGKGWNGSIVIQAHGGTAVMANVRKRA